MPTKKNPKIPKLFNTIWEDIGIVYYGIARFEKEIKEQKEEYLRYVIQRIEGLIQKLQKNLTELKQLLPPQKSAEYSETETTTSEPPALKSPGESEETTG